MKTMRAVISGVVCALLIALPHGAAAADTTAAPVVHDVLRLDEAAALLRLPPAQLLTLAAAGQVPARNIGGEWRFSRAALLEWLQGDRPAGPAPAPHLPAEALRAATGRGEAAGTPPATTPVGEQPAVKTAEEIALRDQGVLLKKGAKTVELGLAYARSERQNFPNLRTEDTAFSASLTARYGLVNDLQVTARLPAVHRRSTVQFLTDPTTADESTVSDQYVGDLSVSLLGAVAREGVGRPNVIVSIDTLLPTGPGDSGLGAGLVLAKSYDPAVLFAGLSYLYGFSVDASEPRRQLAERNLRLTLGYTFALNDTLALSSSYAVSYRGGELSSASVLEPARESHQLELGMTWMLGRGLFIEPAVTIGLGGPGADFAFSLSFPYSF